MKLPFPSGWTLASTFVWTAAVVIAAKLTLWALDAVTPALARAAAAAG